MVTSGAGQRRLETTRRNSEIGNQESGIGLTVRENRSYLAGHAPSV